MPEYDFSDIRPYYNSEVPPVIEALRGNENLRDLVRTFWPTKDLNQLLSGFHSVDSIDGFQQTVMMPGIKAMLNRSVTEFTLSGLERLEPGRQYLFISNHRDITLDSALFGYRLAIHGRKAPQIAIGDNLFMNPWLIHLFKLNKSVIVKRNLSKRDLLRASQKLSAYIHYLIDGDRDSLWLAQQEGRAKDGNDRTQSGIIKMLCLSAQGDLYEHLRSLNIIPLSASYEYDPCDFFKARERLMLVLKGSYQKVKNEDLLSITRGLSGYKGRIHIAIGRPLNEYLADLPSSTSRNEVATRVTDALDREIISNYQLWPSNYLARDLLKNRQTYREHYTDEQRDFFVERLERELRTASHRDALRRLMLQIYANPVRNLERLHAE